jgi:hypothetical protein
MADCSQVHKSLSVAATDATSGFRTWHKEIDLFCRARIRFCTPVWKGGAGQNPLSRFRVALVAADAGTHAVR